MDIPVVFQPSIFRGEKLVSERVFKGLHFFFLKCPSQRFCLGIFRAWSSSARHYSQLFFWYPKVANNCLMDVSGQISSRPHATDFPPKVAFSKGNQLISGTSRLVKYYCIWPECLVKHPFFPHVFMIWFVIQLKLH